MQIPWHSLRTAQGATSSPSSHFHSLEQDIVPGTGSSLDAFENIWEKNHPVLRTALVTLSFITHISCQWRLKIHCSGWTFRSSCRSVFLFLAKDLA